MQFPVKETIHGSYFEREALSMEQSVMRENAHRLMHFVLVQFIALAGWVIVQSFFFLSPVVQVGHNISFAAVMVIEIIWWIATLVIMFVLFRREYNGFVKAVLDLEEANKRLRETTNTIFQEMRNQAEQGD